MAVVDDPPGIQGYSASHPSPLLTSTCRPDPDMPSRQGEGLGQGLGQKERRGGEDATPNAAEVLWRGEKTTL